MGRPFSAALGTSAALGPEANCQCSAGFSGQYFQCVEICFDLLQPATLSVGLGPQFKHGLNISLQPIVEPLEVKARFALE